MRYELSSASTAVTNTLYDDRCKQARSPWLLYNCIISIHVDGCFPREQDKQIDRRTGRKCMEPLLLLVLSRRDGKGTAATDRMGDPDGAEAALSVVVGHPLDRRGPHSALSYNLPSFSRAGRPAASFGPRGLVALLVGAQILRARRELLRLEADWVPVRRYAAPTRAGDGATTAGLQ